MYSTIDVRVENKVMIVTLDRPDHLNAFNQKMLEELLGILDVAEEDDQIRAIVFTGSGKAFCAGLDLENDEQAFGDRDTSTDEFRDIGGMLSLRLYDMKKPVIAAINGHAVGIGITMTLPMDIRIVAEEAKIGFVFTRRGIVPESCSSWFLPRLVGVTKANEWILTGRMIRAAEGLQAGLFNAVVPREKVLEEAMKIATDISENTSATSVALSRQLLWRMLGSNQPMDAHILESKMIHWTGRQKDAHEGVTAFLEKRKPNFTMKVSKDMPDFYPW